MTVGKYCYLTSLGFVLSQMIEGLKFGDDPDKDTLSVTLSE